jgi:hypothetical protein
MNINLFTTFYRDKNEARFNELVFCFNKNVLAKFNNIVVLTESKEDYELVSKVYANATTNLLAHIPALTVGNMLVRPPFNDFFAEMRSEKYKDSINILSNTDIFFDSNSLEAIKHYFENSVSNTCIALSRWDYYPDGSAVHYDRADSQDTWCFLGNPKIRTSTEYTMGEAGCDNRLAFEINEANYNIVNPSKSIKSYHYHNTNIRNYVVNGEVIKRVPPPYLLLNTI